jgi:hypothetical protein
LLCTAPWLRAQEASTDVVGFVEINVAPGKFESIAPLLLPPSTAMGAVNAVIDAGRITPAWFGTLPDPLETGAWFPRNGLSMGRPLFGSPVSGSSDWEYASVFQGTPFAGDAANSLLKVGDRFSVVPFWAVEELAGDATGASIYAAATRTAADTFQFAGQSVWAAKPEGGAARWVSSANEDPASTDAGGSVIPDVTGPTGYQRSTSAAAALRMFVTGVSRAGAVPFRIQPTPLGAGSAVWNPVFRPDGKEFTLSTHLGLFTRSASTGLIGGINADAADKVVIWSPDIQEWEHFYYQTASPAGWRSMLGRPVTPSAVKVPSGAGFYVIRPSTLPELTLKLPAVPSAVLANTKLFPQIVDRDRDRLADGWERANGSADLSMLPGGDPDGDGFTNLQESLLGGNPTLFDQPARPALEVRTTSGGTREAWVRFATASGCRYRVERRLVSASTWSIVGPILVGDGTTREVKDPVALTSADRLPRFYRIVALSWADGDADLVSDWEERNVFGTDPTKADTDQDGVKDGVEVRDARRSALDYYDGRVVSFTVDATTNGLVVPAGEWLRQAITFRVTSGKRALANAPLTVALTNGSGLFAANPGDDANAVPVLTLRTDSAGFARAFFKAGATAGRVQGRMACRVRSAGGLVQLYSGGFFCQVTTNLTLPSTGLVRWFRPDGGLTLASGGNPVVSWAGVGAVGSATAVGTGPTRTVDVGRPWITFTGKEKFSLGAILPNNTFNTYFVAVPTGARVSRTASVAASGVNAGASGQLYLLAGATVPGSSVVVYDAPRRPDPKTFSTWELTNFRFHPYYLSGAPAGQQYWSRSRPYNFPVASARYDITEGYRYGPAPVGIHRAVSTSDIKTAFVQRLGGYFANYQTEYERTSTREIVAFGEVMGYERFYRVSATDWRGTSNSAAYGGVARAEYSRVGEAGFGFSMGAASSGAFELGQYWKPATTGPGGALASGAGVPKGTILGTVRVIDQLPFFDIGGVRRFNGASAFRKATGLLAPQYLGGWADTGSGFQGRLGDVLFYDRDLATEERKAVEDYLAAAYRGTFASDRDSDGLRDWWESTYFGNSTEVANGDLDGDLSKNLEEQTWGTDPTAVDSDGDGISDKAELTAKTSGVTWDTDSDFLPDGSDLLPRDPKNGWADANTNGIPDGVDQLLAATTLTDADGDGLCDLVEAAWLLTNPLVADTDGDGTDDGDEVVAGSDPLLP